MIEVCSVRPLYHTGVERICQVADHISKTFARFPNVNVIHNHNELQVNDNVVSYKEKKQRMKSVQSTASRIAERLGEPQNIKFFYKVAWALPEAVIWNFLEQSQSKSRPGAYFVTLCKLEMTDD